MILVQRTVTKKCIAYEKIEWLIWPAMPIPRHPTLPLLSSLSYAITFAISLSSQFCGVGSSCRSQTRWMDFGDVHPHSQATVTDTGQRAYDFTPRANPTLNSKIVACHDKLSYKFRTYLRSLNKSKSYKEKHAICSLIYLLNIVDSSATRSLVNLF